MKFYDKKLMDFIALNSFCVTIKLSHVPKSLNGYTLYKTLYVFLFMIST